jgi:hypothetical protein
MGAFRRVCPVSNATTRAVESSAKTESICCLRMVIPFCKTVYVKRALLVFELIYWLLIIRFLYKYFHKDESKAVPLQALRVPGG